MNAPRPPLKALDEALAELLAHAQPLPGIEDITTFDGDGRVLARDIVSALHVPPQDNSSMDGYAVRCADVREAGVVLPVSQRIPAGASGAPLQPGSVARIFTGAPVPAGADAIVMQEECEAAGEGSVRVNAVPKPGRWIRRAGEDVTRGAVVLSKGERLAPSSLGLAASIGMSTLPVVRRPRVALFSTGDELVMPGDIAPEHMPPGAIYNSNRFFLRALLQRLGCDVTDYGIVPDQRDATLDALRDAAQQHDLILTSGGVSVGEEDHIKPAVQQLGELDLWQIAIKPGKPFAYGKIYRGANRSAQDACHFAGLPGNPVSSFITFLVLVRPFLLKLQGVVDVAPVSVALPAHFDWPRADKRREFLRVRRNAAGGLELFPNQSSGVLTSAVWGDGVVDNPAGQTIAKGDTVQFMSFAELMG
ncbi:MAG: molybdopterin molybdenumtransferase MoeA [Curvibacter sp. PD_MW3]|nr:MAG: molybdopterin molybdenumtransferase MoeA [Curvibacter sp. PD_MW3]